MRVEDKAPVGVQQKNELLSWMRGLLNKRVEAQK
jgi:hypothetical protein